MSLTFSEESLFNIPSSSGFQRKFITSKLAVDRVTKFEGIRCHDCFGREGMCEKMWTWGSRILVWEDPEGVRLGLS